MVREGNSETIWSRLHARQAFVFGLLASLVLFVVLSFPLLAVIFVPGISTGATIGVYTWGLVLDAIFGVLFLLLALRYSARAARGELFPIPVVTPLVDALFRLKPR